MGQGKQDKPGYDITEVTKALTKEFMAPKNAAFGVAILQALNPSIFYTKRGSTIPTMVAKNNGPNIPDLG